MRFVSIVVCSLVVASLAGAQDVVTEARRLGSSALRIDILVDSLTLPGKEFELAEITFPPGGAAPPHRHGSTEVLYILEGELEHVVNGRAQRLGPGMVGVVRVGDTVRHRVVSSSSVRAIVIWTPAGEAGRLSNAFGVGTRVRIATVADQLEQLRVLRGWMAATHGAVAAARLPSYLASAVSVVDGAVHVGSDSILADIVRRSRASAEDMPSQFTATQVEVRGDLAVERGWYACRGNGATAAVDRACGSYMWTARKDASGAWHVEWSMFSRTR